MMNSNEIAKFKPGKTPYSKEIEHLAVIAAELIRQAGESNDRVRELEHQIEQQLQEAPTRRSVTRRHAKLTYELTTEQIEEQ